MAEGFWVCGKISEQNHDKLNRLAQLKNMTVSDLTARILTYHLTKWRPKGRDKRNRTDNGKRLFTRRHVGTLAYVYPTTQEDKQPTRFTGKLEDVSLGGVKISFGRNGSEIVELLNRNQQCLIVFSLPGNNRKLEIDCRFQRSQVVANDVIIGASFNPIGYSEQVALHRFMN